MRRVWFVAVALLTAVTVALGGSAAGSAKSHPAGPPDTYVTSWDAVGSQAFSAAALTPPEGHTIFAYMAIAVYDSVMAVKGGYEPFAVDVDAPTGASAEAAVAAAAHRILVHYLPLQAPTILDPAYSASLATIPDGQAKTDGVDTGTNVADLLIARARRRRLPGVGDVHAAEPADSRRLDPDGAHAAGRHLPRADASRSASTPRTSSGPTGRRRSTAPGGPATTTRSRRSARAPARRGPPSRPWQPGSGRRPPVQQARGSFRKFVLDHELDIVGASRFMAMISVTYADALIACFDAKYHYAFWRPITAIRAGDTDGNPATVRRSGVVSADRDAEPSRVPERALPASLRPGDASSPDSWGRSRSISPSPA